MISNSPLQAVCVSLMAISKLHGRHPLKILPHLSLPRRHRLLKPKSNSRSCAALTFPAVPSTPKHSPAPKEGQKYLVMLEIRTVQGDSTPHSRVASTFQANEALYPAHCWRSLLSDQGWSGRNCSDYCHSYVTCSYMKSQVMSADTFLSLTDAL